MPVSVNNIPFDYSSALIFQLFESVVEGYIITYTGFDYFDHLSVSLLLVSNCFEPCQLKDPQQLYNTPADRVIEVNVSINMNFWQFLVKHIDDIYLIRLYLDLVLMIKH